MELLDEKIEKLDYRISNFLSTMEGRYTFIVFDLETNGLSYMTDSVLSISAMKCGIRTKDKITKIDSYNRYYYPPEGEEYNLGALNVNGLTEAVITEKRGDAKYDREFLNDIQSFREFCGDCTHFMGHNSLKFDKGFFKVQMEFPYMFDTMVMNEDIVEALNDYGARKSPRLSETAIFYGINPDGPLHQSFWDVLVTAKVFQAMLSNSELRLNPRMLAP